MKLLEHEGKALLQRHGIAIPNGGQWPTVPASPDGWVVKAQILGGRRGKSGGILFAGTESDVAKSAKEMAEREHILGRRIHGIYVEEMVEAVREYYVAALVDRDSGCLQILASTEGGVDIEAVPRELVHGVRIDPIVGLQTYQVRLLANALELHGEIEEEFGKLARALVETLAEEDAELIEINPLALVGDKFLALDAKVVLDDDAVHRHGTRPRPIAWDTDGPFMDRCRELGAIGIDGRPSAVRPNVGILANGAGMTMATYDEVVLSGISVAGAIELHGALAKGIEHTAEVVRTLFTLSADTYFFNIFYQLRSCDDFARALMAALDGGDAPPRERVVVRMRGVEDEKSRDLVRQAGCLVTASLAEATAMTVKVSDEVEAADL